MHRRLAMVGCALALCVGGLSFLAPAGGAQQAIAHRSATAPLGGVNVGPVGPYSLTLADRTIAQAKALHASVIRTEVPWSVVEPQPGQFETRAEAYSDRLVSDAAAAGIRVIMTVDSTPCWESSAPAQILRTCSSARRGQANAWLPKNPASYGQFVGELAARYGTHLAAIEVWNEPDQANELYLAGPEKAVHYAALLRAAYPAVKQANAQVTVLAGSLVGSSGVFLKALYAAGIKGYYDGLAVHFYTVTLYALRRTHEVQLANGDSTPLWLDEFGWASCWPRQRVQEEQGCVTSQTQATNITELVHEMAGTPYIAANVIYKLQDSGNEDFGMLNTSGARKPAFKSLAAVFSSPFGSAPRVSLHLSRSGGHVLATGTGPVGDYLKLTVSKAGFTRFIEEFSLNRFNQFAIPLPAALGTSGLQVRVYQIWAGPHRATQKSI